MRARIGPVCLLLVLTSFVVGCTDDGKSATSATATTAGGTCAAPGATAPAGCWREILPLGSGGFPASPGSSDRPLWAPGKIPVTLTPHLAFGNQLWMTAQTLAYSSPDGLTWTQYDKTDWGQRIYHSIVYFKGKLW